jgi:vacuolar protein sorting-associated protein 35
LRCKYLDLYHVTGLTAYRNIYPERLDYVDQVLAFAQEVVSRNVNSADFHSQNSQSNVLKLFLAPIGAYCSIFTALSLPHFIPLLENQPYPTRRAVAGEVARLLLKDQVVIDSQSNLEAALAVLRVIIKEGAQPPTGYAGGPLHRKAAETDETLEEQGWLARIIHLIQGPVNDIQFSVSMMFKLDIAVANI